MLNSQDHPASLLMEQVRWTLFVLQVYSTFIVLKPCDTNKDCTH